MTPPAQASSSDSDAGNRSASWSAVFAMSLGAFALVASEFMPVSLLTPIASDLRVTEGQAGLAIAVSGAFAVLTSLLIPSLTAHFNRRAVLLSLTVLVVISGAMAAFAPNYAAFMVGRALIGVAIGGFWSLSAATVMGLVPDDDVPRALAVLNGGNALATVIAAPLGSFLGTIVGWRGAFFSIVPIAFAVFFWLLASLPPMKAESRRVSTNIARLLNRPVVALGMVAVSLMFAGQFTLFTYLRPFLETVTHVDASTLSLVLLVIGVAGFIGTTLIAAFLKDGLYRTLIVIPTLMAGIAIALLAFGSSLPITVFLLAIWGLIATSVPVAWWTWLSRTLPQDAEAGGGLMVAIIQMSITFGATIGGVLFDMFGYQVTFAVSAALLFVAAGLAFLTSRTLRVQG